MTTSPFLSATRDDFERLWRRRGLAQTADDAPPPPSFVRFDRATVAAAASHLAATRAAAVSSASLAAATRDAGADPPEAGGALPTVAGRRAGGPAAGAGLLRATAANGLALAAAAVSLAAVDAGVWRGATVQGAASDAGPEGASLLDDPAVSAAFAAARPASADDDARVIAFVKAYPDVGVRALLDHVTSGDARAASLLRRIEASGALAAPVAAARSLDATAANGVDDALLALLRGRSVQSIPDAAALMRCMEALLPDGDGLKAFTTLYRMVTEAVGATQAWEDRAWLERLDMLFADLFFGGVERCLGSPGEAPAAWRALMDRRRRPGIAAVQFALAGMSAHINRDLAVAVVQTWLALGVPARGRDTPEYRDYKRVDDVLDAVEPGAMRLLATGLFQVIEQMLAPVDGWASMQIVHAARDLAWSHAEHLADLGLDGVAGDAYVAALDAMAAGVARAALVAT